MKYKTITTSLNRSFRLGLFALLITAFGSAPAFGQIYFLDEDQIWIAETDGSESQALLEETDKPRGIAIDRVNDFLYWTDDWEYDGQVYRAALDGSGLEVLHEEGTPRGIAVDTENGKIYWADLRNDALMWANLDGSEAETLVATEDNDEASAILDVALDVGAGKVYWTRLGAVMRANLDGSNIEVHADLADHIQPPSIAVGAGHVYWVNPSADDIERASTDEAGAEIETVVNAEEPAGLAIEGDDLYWLNSFLFSGGGGNVMRAALDGSDPELVLDGLAFPEGPLAIMGNGEGTSVGDDNLPQAVRLQQNYPNPFNPTTTLQYELATSQHVSLTVHDMLGRAVAVLVDGVQAAGEHAVDFNAVDLPSGTYIYRLRSAGGTVTRVMTLAK